MNQIIFNLKTTAALTVACLAILVWWLWQAEPSNSASSNTTATAGDTVNDHRDIIIGYRRIASASYEAANHSASRLTIATRAFLAAPSAAGLAELRALWRLARVDYSQTEVFRFGNWVVDDWEGTVNAWPVDEGILDYVNTSAYEASDTNPLARHNLVANANITVGGIPIEAKHLNWTQLKFIHGGSEHESNVVLGYHAIEFMLWGQDLNRETIGSGQRPWTDYAADAACTSGSQPAPVLHCQRRRQLLLTMTEHLQESLRKMTLTWAGSGPASYGEFLEVGDVQEGLRRMLFGMIRLAGDEMAGERMQVALLSGAPEEEQDCFSDDTHQSAYYNAVGIQNIYYGRYENPRYRDGFSYQSPVSMAQLARHTDTDLAVKIDQAFINVEQALADIKQQGEAGQTFDLLIRPDNVQGQRMLQQAITELQTLSGLLEQLGYTIGLQQLNPQAPVSMVE